MNNFFKEWVCIFPGKFGLSWKHAHPYDIYNSKEEAEVEALKYGNVVAVPLKLFEQMKKYEERMVVAERTLDVQQSI